MTQPAPTIQSEDIQEINYRGFVALKAKLGVDIMAQLTEQKAHMLHMAIGVAGEASELLETKNKQHTMEECGDLEFFLEGLTINNNQFQTQWIDYRLGTDTANFARIDDSYEFAATQVEIVVQAGKLLDFVKKYTIYNKPLDLELLRASWQAIHMHLGRLYEFMEVSRLDVLKMNADKLNKRYKAGYSDKEAQERADKKEGN